MEAPTGPDRNLSICTISTFISTGRLAEGIPRTCICFRIRLSHLAGYCGDPKPVSDAEINRNRLVVETEDSRTARLTPFRESNQKVSPPAWFLHASISCKWTIRSDRSQNTRTEALNLIRNRKGPLPHIVAVTAEPLPTRIASLALGTGKWTVCITSPCPNWRKHAENSIYKINSRCFRR